MNICISTSSFPGSANGTSGYFVLELARSLVRAGHRVIVLCPQVMDLPGADDIDGVKIVRFRYMPLRRWQSLIGIRPGIASLKSWTQLAKVPAFLVCQIWALYRLTRSYPINVINSHWLIPQGVTAALVAKICAIRHVPTLHSTDVLLAARLPFAGFLCRFVDRNSHNTFIVSDFVRQRYEAILGYTTRACVVPMGVDAERFSRRADVHYAGRTGGKRILFVGRLHPVKGLDVLVDALPALLEQHPDLGLTVAGDGDMRTDLETRVQRLGVAGHIRFLGNVSNEDLPDLYREADLLIVPSLLLPTGETEGMPVVILEAMACGTPVVASDVGGICDVVKDGINGCLVKPGDASRLAQAINRALEARDMLSDGASTTALDYAWPQVCAVYLEAME